MGAVHEEPGELCDDDEWGRGGEELHVDVDCRRHNVQRTDREHWDEGLQSRQRGRYRTYLPSIYLIHIPDW